MPQDKFAQKRDEIIERIKQVFPKKPRLMGKKATFEITHSNADYYPEGRDLREVFNEKRWEELIDNPDIIYMMSDVDYAGLIHDKAYLYYLPAVLVSTLKGSSFPWEYSYRLFEKIREFLSRFTLDQLETLIAYFEFLVDYVADGDSWYLEPVEDMLLRVMIRRDEVAKETGQ
jgi:hypothetical protein